jgi:hypothetical protein
MRTVTVRGFDLTIHERGDWQTATEPITPPPAASPELVHHAVCHYPGSGDTWVPPTDVAAHLRSQQHWGLGAKGYNYWYNFVIGPNAFPDIWEVRGFDIRNAANNGDKPPYSDFEDPNWNGYTVSIQIMCSTAHPPTADQIKSFQYCLAMCDDFYGETLTLIGHRDSDDTDCPGPAYPLVLDGTLATRPPEEGDLANADDLMAELQATKLIAQAALEEAKAGHAEIAEVHARLDRFADNEFSRDMETSKRDWQRFSKLLEQLEALVPKA